MREGRLVVQRCEACGALAVPPKAVCPSCESIRWGRATLGGDGEITSYTVIRVPPAQFAAEAPYVVAVARMTEGVSLLGRLTGTPIDACRWACPSASPARPRTRTRPSSRSVPASLVLPPARAAVPRAANGEPVPLAAGCIMERSVAEAA